MKGNNEEFLVWNNFTSFQTDPVEYVENMCENMQLYPLQDFLTGDQLLFEYKPEVRRFPFLKLTFGEKGGWESAEMYLKTVRMEKAWMYFVKCFV